MNRHRIYKWPRTLCPNCGRTVAVMPNKLVIRHDPIEGHPPGEFLTSCTGSLNPAPGADGSTQAPLFSVQDVTPQHLWAPCPE